MWVEYDAPNGTLLAIVCGNSFPQAEHVNIRWLMALPCRLSVSFYFEKLATAAASVLNTWKTVTSFVICRISWDFVPKLLRMSDAP